jgi:hypothetical protein
MRDAVVALSVVLMAGFAYHYKAHPPFRSQAWQSSTGWPYPRLSMADDLLRRGLLAGLDGDSVLKLLGPKTPNNYFPQSDFVYWLGPERGLIRVDSEWLVIDLGPDGMVARAEIVTD